MKLKLMSALLCGAVMLSAVTCNAAVKGDVDLDNKITATDATFAMQYTLVGSKTNFTDEQIKAADFDEDGVVTASDASYILQKTLRPEFDIKKDDPKPDNPDTSDGVVVASFDELTNAISAGEKKIYVKGSIYCTNRLELKSANAGMEFYGLTNDDGTGAAFNFAGLRDSQSSSGSGGTGIYISGTGYSFKNLIIENAGDCGVRITGSSAGDCTFTNCVFRYNNNSGISVTKGGHDNKFYNCDSYRNGDTVQKSGADADGYSVKLAAGAGNYFYNCRAWENSDDGWDSYDRKSDGGLVPDVTYIECLAWHNGNPDTFTGEYDYKMGYPLDKNLIYVKALIAADSSFEHKYNNRELDLNNWPQVTMKLLGKTNTYSKLYSAWGGNPNGFKFGSAESDSTEYRYIENCIAFDHYGNGGKPVQYRAKGFDQNCGDTDETSQNGAKLIHYDMKNILSFNNVENIQMSRMTADSINGVVWSFDNCLPPENDTEHYAAGGYADQPSEGMTIIEPANKDELRDKVYAYREMIYSYVYNDKIPGEQICDVFN